MAARSMAIRPGAAMGLQSGAIALALGRRGGAGLPRAAGQIIQSAELHRRPAPRVVQGLPRFPPSFVPGRQHSRPHRRADLSLLAVGERRHRRNPRGGGRRFARRANCRAAAESHNRRRSPRLRPAGSDDRAPRGRASQPARPARRQSGRRLAAGVQAAVVAGRGAADGRFPRRARGHSPGKTGR